MKSFGDWGGFFAKMSPDRLIWLNEQFGVDPTAPDASVAALNDDAYGRLTDLRASVEDLARPESYVLSDILSNIDEIAPADRGAEDVAVWLAQRHPLALQDGLEMLDYDKAYQREAYWTGVEVKTSMTAGSINPANAQLRAAIAACLQQPNRPLPDIILHSFSRPSPRSGARGVHLTISYGGPLESRWTIKDKKRALATFAPERVASIVIDPDAGTIDVVSREATKSLRAKLLEALMPHLGAEGAVTTKIVPRTVSLESLFERRTFPLLSDDGVERVRFVAVKIGRRALGDLTLDARLSEVSDVWAAWDGWSERGPGFGTANIRSATLEFVFPASGKQKSRRRVLRLHGASGLVHRGWSPEHSATAERLLMRWGLLSRPGKT